MVRMTEIPVKRAIGCSGLRAFVFGHNVLIVVDKRCADMGATPTAARALCSTPRPAHWYHSIKDETAQAKITRKAYERYFAAQSRDPDQTRARGCEERTLCGGVPRATRGAGRCR